MAVPPRSAARRAHGRHNGYLSGLEELIAGQLDQAGIKYVYEDRSRKICFQQPAKNRTYLPDFILPNGVIIETKGRFTTADRQKHLWIKDQHPQLDIRFVFSNPKTKLNKLSSTTYADWCTKHGFQYAHKQVPASWLKEPRRKLHGNG